LANQVSFLNRAALERSLHDAPPGTHVLLDARRTDYIDPDVLSLIRNFRDVVAPAHGVRVSLRGFREKYQLHDDIQFVDYTTQELQEQLTPAKVLQILHEGNQRFRSGRSLDRDLKKQLREEIVNQHPMAVLISGIHSRIPAELIFDLGLGDIFSIRVGGNVVGAKVVGCAEYGCAVAGAKLILVMGHTGSAMITAAVHHCCRHVVPDFTAKCPNLQPIVDAICESIDPSECDHLSHATPEEFAEFIDQIARRNVLHSVNKLLESSAIIRRMADDGMVAVVGAMYDVATGEIEFLLDESNALPFEKAEEALLAARSS
jgi:carbonic anhydrase/SulP family sulfate permease